MSKIKQQLPQIMISQAVYDLILSKYEIKFVDDIGPYRNGYQDKLTKVCDLNRKVIIAQAVVINRHIDSNFNPTQPWKQYVMTLDPELTVPYKDDFSPIKCKLILETKLKKLGLTSEDISNRLNQFQAEKDERYTQWHDTRSTKGIIRKFENCVYYDINKAHSDALGEIFPELKDWLAFIAKLAKTDKKWKSVPNYYVGLLAFKTAEMRKNHMPAKFELTYNWIVQRTTKTLFKRYEESVSDNSRVVYVNTDGIVIQNPIKIIPSSNQFGQFKIESPETTYYTYRGENYEIVQYGDTIKGSLPLALRQYVDLRKGQVISYKRRLNENNIYVYEDIKQFTVETQEN